MKPRYDPVDEGCRVILAIVIALHLAIVGAFVRNRVAPPPPLTAITNRAALEPLSDPPDIRA